MRRRLPRLVEREVAKFLSTLGFKDYGNALWNLAQANDEHHDTSRSSPKPSPELLRQLFGQARHDPGLLASGPAAVPNLPCRERNLRASHGVSGADLLAGISTTPSVLFVVGKLDDVAIEQIGMLVRGLRRIGATAFTAIVTEEHATDRAADLMLTDVQLFFWKDRVPELSAGVLGDLALLVHTIGAPAIVVLSGNTGLEMIGRFGRALTSTHRLYALLETQPDATVRPLTNIYHLRITAPYATILARSESEADVLRSGSTGLDGPGIVALSDDFTTIFGSDFDDLRPQASQKTIRFLLNGGKGRPQIVVEPLPAAKFDITATIVFHRERELALPSLASLEDMVLVAKAHGLAVEARALLDNADDITRDLVARHGDFLDDVQTVSFGNAAKTRNAGIDLAGGRFLVFLDGDDLWGTDWLLRSYRAATREGAPTYAIWHAEMQFVFWASDCQRSSKSSLPHAAAQSSFSYLSSSASLNFEPRDILMANQWNPTSLAPREVYRRFRYRPDEWTRQIGIQDWRWNLETMGHGIPHLTVPDTIHLIRIKEGGSLGQLQNASGLLPILA